MQCFKKRKNLFTLFSPGENWLLRSKVGQVATLKRHSGHWCGDRNDLKYSNFKSRVWYWPGMTKHISWCIMRILIQMEWVKRVRGFEIVTGGNITWMDNLKSAMDVGISRGKNRYSFIVCLFQRDLVICKHLARWNGNS